MGKGQASIKGDIMELHFYTTWANIQLIEQGKESFVWLKDSAEPTNIHVSFHLDDYWIRPLQGSKYLYGVQLTSERLEQQRRGNL